jgi:hypothetical protein
VYVPPSLHALRAAVALLKMLPWYRKVTASEELEGFQSARW